MHPSQPSLFSDDDSGAIFSPCRRYRYLLWRRWNDKPACVFGMLNPSDADAAINDRTVARCQKWAYAWGFGALFVWNLFAFRTKHPLEMMAAADPIGPDNDRYILSAVANAGLIVCAWGSNGGYLDRDRHVLALLRGHDLYALAFTNDQRPRHPLYLSGRSTPTLWKVGAVAP